MPLEDLAMITARNSVESPSLRLPGELRNKIYYYTIGGHAIYNCHGGTGYEQDRWHQDIRCDNLDLQLLLHRNKDWPNQHEEYKLHDLCSISLVCRQIARETKNLLFGTNVFLYMNHAAYSGELHNLTPEQRAEVCIIASGGSFTEQLIWGCYEAGNVTPSLPHIREIFPNVKKVFIGWSYYWHSPPDSVSRASRWLFDGEEHSEGCEVIQLHRPGWLR